jgi:AcrR family transcriptional regulator
LDVAREVFLEHGIRATTAEVAARAGVSEGTLFHRFNSKDELFRAAMRFNPDQVPEFLESLAKLAGQEDLRKTLVTFAERMLEIGRVALPVMMMSWSNPTGEYNLEKTLKRAEGYRRAFRAVRGFFEAEMRGGRLRKMDPEVLTRIFMGSLHHYCLSELFGLMESGNYLTPPQFARGLADTLLAAAAEPTHKPSKKTGTGARRSRSRS